MAGDNKEQQNKYSTDTLMVLLLVISGLIVVVGGAYAWFRPKNVSDRVVVKDIQVTPEIVVSPTIEDPMDSLEDSYLREGTEEVTDKVEEEPVAQEPKVVEESVKDETPIFNTTVKKTPVQTTIIKKPNPPKKKLVTVKGYWIQVGSFKTSATAQATVEALKEKGLSSRVVLKDINGVNWYRVRIGVYENRDEAQKFCDEVKKIMVNNELLFKDSYVSETTTKKYVEVK